MIVRPRLSWFRMLLVWRGSVVPKILPRLGVLFVLACAVSVLRAEHGPLPLPLEPSLLGLLGVTLAIFLGFRNSTSYERFWEARKLWGQLLIVARSFARQSFTLLAPPLDEAERREVTALLSAIARGLNQQLRPTEGGRILLDEDVPEGLRERIGSSAFAPALILRELGAWLGRQHRSGRVDPILCAAMDGNLDKLSEVIGGCERIATTPIPLVYSVLLHRTVYLYSAVLPVALVDRLGYWTPLVSLFVSYTFIALDAVSAELEDPFGFEPNDLPLDAMTRTVERATRELGDLPLPPALEPDQNFLLR